MEFASEMVIRATREQLDVREIPIELHPRVGTSKLSPFRDGWRHLRVILVYNPTFLFLLPGAVMLALGSLIVVLVLVKVPLFGRGLYTHSLIGGCLLVILAVQAIGFGLCASAYGVYFISDQDQIFLRLRARFRLEHGLVAGGDRRHRGVHPLRSRRRRWAASGFGALSETRLAILAATLIVVAAQIFFTSFMLSILGLRRRPDEP